MKTYVKLRTQIVSGEAKTKVNVLGDMVILHGKVHKSAKHNEYLVNKGSIIFSCYVAY